jgi:ribosomal protein S18 acetylase RimI-like enzyme
MILASTYIVIVGGEGMIRLRAPFIDDLHLYRLILKQLLPKARTGQPELRLDKKAAIFRLAKSIVFVAARRGKPPFGFISLKIKQRVLFIDLLAVDASNVNQGWGSLLITTGEQYGKNKGCFEARVFVDQSNEHAIQFYSKKGYEIKDYMPIVDCYLMQKDLRNISNNLTSGGVAY